MAALPRIFLERNLFSCFLLSKHQKIFTEMSFSKFHKLLTHRSNHPHELMNKEINLKYACFKDLSRRCALSSKICHRLARCSTSKILMKQTKKYQRSRNDHPNERSTSSLQFRAAKIKEAKKKMASKVEELKENVITIPNALCVLRMAATPILGYLVLQEFYATSLGLFLVAGCTDVVDGYIARTFPGQQSMIGSFLDPAADKLLIATLFISLTVNGLIPVPLTSMIILRDICLFSAGFYIRYVSLPPPKTLSRYFDASFATARLRPTVISKVNTMVQLSLVACSLAAPVFGYMDHYMLPVLWYITGTTTVLSAASYLYYKNTYKLLLPNKIQKTNSKNS